MARLPQPGGDQGNWGTILNDFLTQSLDADGSIKAGVVDASAIADGTISELKLDSAAQAKLNSGGTAGVVSVNTRSGAVTLTAADVGLANANNTSDANKPISIATQAALDGKEATISAGTTSQYYRGDKSWQTLDKTSVGLANVDNTTDVNKPISSATQAALDAKADLSALTSGLAGKANASHTHTSADITDLAETTQDTIASTLVAGTNVTLNYNDGAGTLTVSATPGAGVTDLSTTYAADSVTVVSSTGNDAVIDDATTSNAGVLSASDKTKLDGIQVGAEANAVDSVAGKTGVVTLVKADVGLANVDNTSDANKPISTATQTALNAKADATAVGAKLLLIDQAVDLPPGTPAGVVVVVKNP